jgi:hypothetical protein
MLYYRDSKTYCEDCLPRPSESQNIADVLERIQIPQLQRMSTQLAAADAIARKVEGMFRAMPWLRECPWCRAAIDPSGGGHHSAADCLFLHAQQYIVDYPGEAG